VEVAEHPEIAPHTVLSPGGDSAGQPPPDIAADPGRMAFWSKLHGKQNAEIDSWGKVYELNGCGKKTVYVCAHPTVLDVASGNGYIVGNNSTTANDTVISAVQCLPDLKELFAKVHAVVAQAQVAAANARAMANEAMNQPGSAELRAKGCTQVVIADATKTDPTSGVVNVICRVDGATPPPACDDLAHTYVASGSAPTTLKMLNISTYGPGQMTPSCSKMYGATGAPYVYHPPS